MNGPPVARSGPGHFAPVAQRQSAQPKQLRGRGFDPLRVRLLDLRARLRDDEACELDSQATEPLRYYVVVRADLPAPTALAMTVHAAGETGPAPPHTIAVVLQVPNENDLLALAHQLGDAHLIREPDPPWNGATMALALRPGARRRELKHLRLWGSMRG